MNRCRSRYKDYKLCFIRENKAYFTKKDLSEQWGDDWGDSPYEHNAGEPYYDKQSDIVSIYYDVYYYKEPNYHHINSPYSVEIINERHVPWLSQKFDNHLELPPIYAGCNLNKFIDLIILAGGDVFVPLKF